MSWGLNAPVLLTAAMLYVVCSTVCWFQRHALLRWWRRMRAPTDAEAQVASFMDADSHSAPALVPRLGNMSFLDTDFPRDCHAKAVKVAVLDTGCTPHEVVLPNSVIIASRSFVQGDPLCDLDESGHGTSSACLIAGGEDQETTSGRHTAEQFQGGVVPQLSGRVQLLIGQVSSGASTFQSTIAHGLKWAIDNEAQVVCIPFEVKVLARPLLNAFRLAEQAGVLVVIAAGNSGADDPVDVPQQDTVLVVGAHDDQRQACHWMRTAPAGAVLAPGTGVVTITNAAPALCFNTRVAVKEGTSPATALMTGVVAYMMFRGMTVAQVRAKLRFLQRHQILQGGAASTGGALFQYVPVETGYSHKLRVFPGGPPLPPPEWGQLGPETDIDWAKRVTVTGHPSQIVGGLTRSEQDRLLDLFSNDATCKQLKQHKHPYLPAKCPDGALEQWADAFTRELQRAKSLANRQ